MTFSVLDLPKEEDKGNDGHASKVIVVPFDGEALERGSPENSITENRNQKVIRIFH